MHIDRWKKITAASSLAAALAWPGIGAAQLGGLLPGLPGGGGASALSGQASAVQVTALGLVTSLGSTGTLTQASEPLGTGQALGSIPGLLSAEALHAATMGWTDQVYSEASLGNLALSVLGTGITADAILSRAFAAAGAAPIGASSIDGLRIGGAAIPVSGLPNQLVSLPGLSVILNEQLPSAGGIVVNALRVRTLDGLTDIVVGTSRAGI
jgi:hypothetical protein